jgi:hypothetical protein
MGATVEPQPSMHAGSTIGEEEPRSTMTDHFKTTKNDHQDAVKRFQKRRHDV